MTDPDGDRCGLAYKDYDGEYKLLTGNQSAALLIDYLLSEKTKKGTLPKDGVLYDTVVSSSLGREIAHSYGVKSESFLTGFKYIGDRIAYYEKYGGPTFVFGYEESYGCLVGPFVRDKDGLQAILLYTEMTLFYLLQGKKLSAVYDELQKRFGYRKDSGYSIYFRGREGQKVMFAILDGLRKSHPTTIDGLKVLKVRDYLKSEVIIDGKVVGSIDLPKSDVLIYDLEDGSEIAIRPSGTEPKCKFYIGVRGKDKESVEKYPDLLYAKLKKELGLD